MEFKKAGERPLRLGIIMSRDGVERLKASRGISPYQVLLQPGLPGMERSILAPPQCSLARTQAGQLDSKSFPTFPSESRFEIRFHDPSLELTYVLTVCEPVPYGCVVLSRPRQSCHT